MFKNSLCIAALLFFHINLQAMGEKRVSEKMPATKLDKVSAKKTCDWYKEKVVSCEEFQGLEKSVCRVCKEKVSCGEEFSESANNKNFCQVYLEKNSCGQFKDSANRGWCEHLRERKSCSRSFSDSDLIADCQKNRLSRIHLYWFSL